MKKTNPNTEIAALKNTIKQKDEALAELAHENIGLHQKLKLSGMQLNEVAEKGRVAELALGGVRQLRENATAVAVQLADTQCKLEVARKRADNLHTALRDSEATARWYKLAFRTIVLGNLITAAVICFKFVL